MKELGFTPKNESEEIMLTGFLPRNPQVKQAKNGDYFKVFTLGVYLDEEGKDIRWYSLTAPESFDAKHGEIVTIPVKVWKRFYTSRKTGERRLEWRGTLLQDKQ